MHIAHCISSDLHIISILFTFIGLPFSYWFVEAFMYYEYDTLYLVVNIFLVHTTDF